MAFFLHLVVLIAGLAAVLPAQNANSVTFYPLPARWTKTLTRFLLPLVRTGPFGLPSRQAARSDGLLRRGPLRNTLCLPSIQTSLAMPARWGSRQDLTGRCGSRSKTDPASGGLPQRESSPSIPSHLHLREYSVDDQL